MPDPRPFEVVSEFDPMGDQPEAIARLTRGIEEGKRHQCLLGATGTGKTFTMANVIAETQKPTLIISHNKTLAAQLYEELREFFPHNSVNYFVSYYDYYQPEAYIPGRDIYIEKDASRNDDLDQLRLASTSNLLSRRDSVVIASVSCIFGLGSPSAYSEKVMTITRGSEIGRRDFFMALNAMQYQRSDIDFKRGTYRARGDAIEVWPAYEKFAVRIEIFGDEIDKLELINPVSGELLAEERQFFLFPAVHYVMPEDQLQAAIDGIRTELDARVLELRSQGKLLEAQRLLARTKYDLEMIEEVGFCNGIENYSRYMDGRAPGERPFTLLDYFDYAPPDPNKKAEIAGKLHAEPDAGAVGRDAREDEQRYGVTRQNLSDWLVIIDESHVTIPQINAMFNGDKARKDVLVEHGFRLPSALDNRPLRFEEFEAMVPRLLFVSATPGPYELDKVQGEVAEQVIRPTGLLDPVVEIRPAQNQIADLIEACRERVDEGDRVLVTALTKRLCEDLTNYLAKQNLRVRYLHSEIDTLERVEIIQGLRMGEFDVLVGVNLLREGLDMPEVSLVCILDADKEGYLRSATSLIQQMGRAARNDKAKVILYADTMTSAMSAAIGETERRRAKQMAYNEEHGITPATIRKSIRRGIEAELKSRRKARDAVESDEPMVSADDLVATLEGEMLEAAEQMKFERAASLRDQMRKVQDLIEAEKVARDSDPTATDEEKAGPVMVRRSEIERAISGRPKGKKKRRKTGKASSHRSKSRRPGR
ncbi:MAG: excinuclease ABC subunit UvrB [Planctomycetota bacterium]